MSEEPTFQSIKITLSEEALRILDVLRKKGSFRSNSMTVEETIRALHDILRNVEIAEMRAEGKSPVPDHLKLEAARDIAIRLARFRIVEE